MSQKELEGALIVPARAIPVPRHVSPQAQAALGRPWQPRSYPALDDHDAWHRQIAAGDALIMGISASRTDRIPSRISERCEDGVPGFEVVPEEVRPDDRRVYLDLHGGGLIQGSGEVCRVLAHAAADRVRARVVAPDYRMPPDHPYPAAVDDCLTFYRALLRDHRPQQIIVGGSSAGANLAGAVALRARDEGLPLPAATVMLSPEIDLTESGDTFQTNNGIDTVMSPGLMPANLLYANGHDLAHPYLSPLFGDFTRGFPPTLLTAGTRDIFLSNAVRMHRALRSAGIQAELHVIEAAPHGGFGGSSPEEAEMDGEVRAFCEKIWG